MCKVYPKLCYVSSPLWDLTKKDTKWRWGPKKNEAFNEIKDRLVRAPTRLTTDASPVGIGAILEQKQEDEMYRPIYYASRKLSKDIPSLKERR